jgi:hypothetical protein
MHFTLISWVALAFIPYLAVVVVFLPKIMRRSAPDTTALRWMFSQPAWLFAWVAALTGGPQWIFGVGSIECLILMLLALREARRESRPPAADHGGVAATE